MAGECKSWNGKLTHVFCCQGLISVSKQYENIVLPEGKPYMQFGTESLFLLKLTNVTNAVNELIQIMPNPSK